MNDYTLTHGSVSLTWHLVCVLYHYTNSLAIERQVHWCNPLVKHWEWYFSENPTFEHFKSNVTRSSSCETKRYENYKIQKQIQFICISISKQYTISYFVQSTCWSYIHKIFSSIFYTRGIGNLTFPILLKACKISSCEIHMVHLFLHLDLSLSSFYYSCFVSHAHLGKDVCPTTLHQWYT